MCSIVPPVRSTVELLNQPEALERLPAVWTYLILSASRLPVLICPAFVKVSLPRPARLNTIRPSPVIEPELFKVPPKVNVPAFLIEPVLVIPNPLPSTKMSDTPPKASAPVALINSPAIVPVP